MASLSSSSKPLHFSWHVFSILFLAFLLLSSSAATRPGRTLMEDSVTAVLRHQLKERSRFQGMVFNVLPKGTPIPPSGPSKRHNSVVNSSPEN
ncbi:hypothetical protein LguiA_032511 [Lonicera macranthoides]